MLFIYLCLFCHCNVQSGFSYLVCASSHLTSFLLYCFLQLGLDGEQPSMMHSCGAQLIHIQHNSHPKAQGSLQKRRTAGLLDPEGQGVCCETRSPRKFRSCHHKVSPTWLPKQELNRDNTNLCARVGGAKTINPQPCTRNCRQLRDVRKRRVFFIEECANWLSHIKRSALKTYVQIPFYRLLPTRKRSFPDHGREQP